ncbi:DUF7331 family protein [Natrinema salinisoli]|uniref:DUF7331 family protein n=1 Tax=Natrinema salinisoli TaxID=2878535 RepID=UPI001CF09F4D|nr:hypothetical protein [Natrinema salinisoli]
MRTNTERRDETVVPDDGAFDQYVSYAASDGTVICDRENPAAWIRSTDVRPCLR